MNLSLIITLILIAIVIPSLWRLFFVRPSADNKQWLEPQLLDARDELHEVHPKKIHHETMLGDSVAILPTQKIATHKLKYQRDLLDQYRFKTLHVVALPRQSFAGYELLQALQSAGLEYGEDELFHYYSNDETEDILFSVASSRSPGTFNLQTIGAFSTPALTFFLDTEQIKHPEMIYDIMLNMAEQLAEELGGEVKAK